MKKLIYLLFISLFYQTQIAQERINISFFDASVFKTEESKKTSESTNFNSISSSEIKIESPLMVKVNSEGKFLLNDSSKAFFGEIEKKSDAKKGLNDKNIALVVDAKQEFINKVILERLQEELNKLIVLDESFTYGDRNIDLYRDYSQLENKLIITKYLNSEIEIQIGNSVYPYLNKLLKTEIDKTLQNSLNLLAINF